MCRCKREVMQLIEDIMYALDRSDEELLEKCRKCEADNKITARAFALTGRHMHGAYKGFAVAPSSDDREWAPIWAGTFRYDGLTQLGDLPITPLKGHKYSGLVDRCGLALMAMCSSLSGIIQLHVLAPLRSCAMCSPGVGRYLSHDKSGCTQVWEAIGFRPAASRCRRSSTCYAVRRCVPEWRPDNGSSQYWMPDGR
jgi:hypothetical protein